MLLDLFKITVTLIIIGGWGVFTAYISDWLARYSDYPDWLKMAIGVSVWSFLIALLIVGFGYLSTGLNWKL